MHAVQMRNAHGEHLHRGGISLSGHILYDSDLQGLRRTFRESTVRDYRTKPAASGRDGQLDHKPAEHMRS